LAALFAVCLKGLLATINTSSPKWQLGESLIGTNPGLGFRPIADDVDQGSLIWYDSTNETQINYWVNLIDTFLDGDFPYMFTKIVNLCC
jgi:sodium/potassium-transporting ATPase subunit beta